ncbi:DedA family protein [Allosalinactinospora lopnorensis]|uniref:DedA family protein n=1 Tax=Allosalinactinospora lopnorensis TaxID=1352348 RepID=UPI000623E795|nr:VTT domain-containing protein [Allosalinactinospora lopnorensis]
MQYGFLEGQSFLVVYSTLFGIVFLRTQATYWIGRGVGAGLERSRYAERLGERLRRAQKLINRFGPPAVTVSYVTWGVQTAVHFAAGAMRMHFVRYLVAMLPGCALWAAIYSLGGMAVLGVWWNLFVHSPCVAVAAAVLLAALTAGGVYLNRRKSAAGRGAGGESVAGPMP